MVYEIKKEGMWMKTLLVFLMSVLMILSLTPVQAKSVYKELQCEELNQATRVNGIRLFINDIKIITVP